VSRAGLGREVCCRRPNKKRKGDKSTSVVLECGLCWQELRDHVCFAA
jgi:hypothetical protein